MGSVCGQHDFIDLVRLNNAIFWGWKRVCVTMSYGNMNKHQAGIYYITLYQMQREMHNTQTHTHKERVSLGII